ncbi:MAG: restriction endonuclease subunit S [Methylotenera sp.]|nr:restriction endonuclease subunit S [Methylotenera sp.]MDD4925725.1 restriction endonuclease subunit S [Methylotenera sp.]
MSSEWKATTLGEVTNWRSGGTPKKETPAYWNGEIPWISANSMHGTRYSSSDLQITYDGLINGSRLALKDSILLLVRGSALHNRIPVGIATRDVAFNQDVKALTAKQEAMSPWYLLFWLMGQENFLLNNVVEYTGIGAGKLDTKRMQELEILLPPRKEQDSIIELIKAVDDRIILLRETSATLEAIAQAMFKSWFVDFDPVHAKQQGRAPEGMDEATATLFPDGFEESELGLVPKGWKVDSVYNVSTVIYGAPFASSKFNTDVLGKPLIRIRDLKDEAPGTYTDEVHPKGYLVQPGDIVVGMDGEFRAYLWGGQPAWLNQRVCVFAPKLGVSSAFVRLSITPLLAAVEASETATTVIHLGKNDIDRFRVRIPDAKVLEEFGNLVNPLYEKIVESKLMAATLSSLRDTLLPRLISGQLRLPEAETVLEEAAA